MIRLKKISFALFVVLMLASVNAMSEQKKSQSYNRETSYEKPGWSEWYEDTSEFGCPKGYYKKNDLVVTAYVENREVNMTGHAEPRTIINQINEKNGCKIVFGENYRTFLAEKWPAQKNKCTTLVNEQLQKIRCRFKSNDREMYCWDEVSLKILEVKKGDKAFKDRHLEAVHETQITSAISGQRQIHSKKTYQLVIEPMKPRPGSPKIKYQIVDIGCRHPNSYLK